MLKQKGYLVSEKQYHCDICSEAVISPLCPVCISAEVDAWTTLYPALRKELLPKIKNYLEKVNENISDATICIKCKKARTNICPYCFLDFIEGELKKLNVIPKVMEEFYEFFDFDKEVPNPHKAKWEILRKL